MSDQVSADFVFGTLASDDLRLAQTKAALAGVSHDLLLHPADPQPGEAVAIAVELGPEVVADQVCCYYTTDGSLPSGAHGITTNGVALPMRAAGADWDTLLWGYRARWIGELPAQPDGTLVRYIIETWSNQGGESHWATQIAGVVAGVRPAAATDTDARLFASPDSQLWPLRRSTGYGYHVDTERVPEWLQEAVIYHVFVDRFAAGEGHAFAAPETPGGFYGGTLRGVIEQIEYISSLGTSCIWLSPLFPSPSHHGYDATDYQTVEPRLGSEADLRELIEAAHARGIRVILDYVANHMSSSHPAFQRAIGDEQSAERGWFTFAHWPDQYLTFFGVQDLPQIDTDNPAARAYLIESARHWLNLGVDGFRCDYANGPSHGFWSAFRAANRATSASSITLGEVVETPALQRSYQGRLDGCLDFLLLQALRQFFAFGTLTPTGFDSFLTRHFSYFPADFTMPSFLDNHDMNRFLWVVGGDTRRLKLAALCQFTLPQPPITYYGTEVGLSQVRDVRYADGSGHPEESRLPMLWGNAQNSDLLDFYRKLGALRQATPATWHSLRTTLLADDATGLYVYHCQGVGVRGANEVQPNSPALQRREPERREPDRANAGPIIVLNNSPNPQQYELPTAAATLRLATGADVRLEGGTLMLAAYGGAVV